MKATKEISIFFLVIDSSFSKIIIDLKKYLVLLLLRHLLIYLKIYKKTYFI